MNAVILHGMPSPGEAEYYNPAMPSASNAHWLPWLQKQLMVRDIYAQTPEMPNSWKPDYATWRHEFERYDCGPDTMLIGHSCGAGFIVRWLSEHPDIRVNKVLLVAPWLDPQRTDTTDFFDFIIDPQLANRTAGLTVFYSDDDFASIAASVAMLRTQLSGVAFREFHNYGHFCSQDIGTDAFPELLEPLLTQQPTNRL